MAQTKELKATSGTVLNRLEIVNEYGILYRYRNNIPQGEPIWIYYDGLGNITAIEEKSTFVARTHTKDENQQID